MNKFVKRGFTGLLALTLAAGMSVPAFAADADAAVQKDYRLTNAGTVSPAETFHFLVEKVSVAEGTRADGSALTTADMPALTISDAAYAAGTNGVKDLIITPASAFPNVGIYTYKVTETAGDTAGVTYDAREMELKATVYYDAQGALAVEYAFRPDGENKGEDIVNEYSAGSLTVGKTVTGNFGDKNREFNIDVTFTAPAGKTVRSDITYGDSTISPSEWVNGTVTRTVSLSSGEQVRFDNVPYGVTYTVAEQDYSGESYTASYDNAAAGSIAAAGVSTTVTNSKITAVDTGVILNSAPYILLLAGVGAAAAAFLLLKKRREV